MLKNLVLITFSEFFTGAGVKLEIFYENRNCCGFAVVFVVVVDVYCFVQIFK